MTRVAAYDCGTNSLRLLVADVVDGHLSEVARELRIVRLGESVDRTGRLSDAALARTFTVLDEYADLAGRHGATRVRFCATSAARDAENAADFAAGVRQLIGVDPEVLTGPDEAALSFTGAVTGVPDVARPVLVVDIGGGSTELILGTGASVGTAIQAESLDIGSVRLTERHLHSDPPTPAEVDAAVADIDAALDQTRVPIAEAATVIGVAGTVTTLAAGALGLTEYDRRAVHAADLPVADVVELGRTLIGLRAGDRGRLGYIHPGRIDVIGAGALILERVLRRSGVQRVRVSESDILDAIAMSLG